MHQQLQGIDFKAGAYSEFAAALSECSPLTLGFLASTEAVDDVPCYCFCPCSKQMASWRAEKLADSEDLLFQDVTKCRDQQFTPEGLEEHCNAIMRNSGDLESRFLHGMVHKYLEALFGQSHAAFQIQAIDHSHSVVALETDVSPDFEPVPDKRSDTNEEFECMKQVRWSISCCTGREDLLGFASDIHPGVENQLNTQLLEKLEVAEKTRQQMEAKSAEASATASSYEKELRLLRERIDELSVVSYENVAEIAYMSPSQQHPIRSRTKI